MEERERKHFESHEQMIDHIVQLYFGESPQKIERMTMGICNEVYSVILSNREIIVRLSETDRFLKGSSCHIPIFQKLGIRVPEILGEDYSKTDIPMAYQFLSKVEGRDIGYVIEDLTDEQLRMIAREISTIFDITKTIPASDKLGDLYGDFSELSDTWTERIRLQIDKAKERGLRTGVMDGEMESILEEIYTRYKSYFDHIQPVVYVDDMCSKNVMVDDGKFSGLVDLDCIAQGDSLEAIGRIQTSWFGTRHGKVYTDAIMDEQHLNREQRKMVLVYALLTRIAWTCENGIQFNANTSATVDREKESRDKDLVRKLYQELKACERGND